MVKRGLIAAFAMPWLALAHASVAEEAERKVAVEEVIVTAQRTEASDVPIAVTALTGEMLKIVRSLRRRPG
jgi:outer membrane receptor protein involved in Fe transport